MNRIVSHRAIFVSPAEAAALLRVNEATIRREFHRGAYPNAVCAGRCIRIPASDLGLSAEVAEEVFGESERLMPSDVLAAARAAARTSTHVLARTRPEQLVAVLAAILRCTGPVATAALAGFEDALADAAREVPVTRSVNLIRGRRAA